MLGLFKVSSYIQKKKNGPSMILKGKKYIYIEMTGYKGQFSPPIDLYN